MERNQKLAEQGNAIAQFLLGAKYATGDGVPKDSSKAAEWFLKAAAQGHAESQFRLARMYAFGEGVPKDEAKAASWYEKAAVQGHVRAQGVIGDLYYQGKGVPQDNTIAVRWLQKAADQGDETAQGNLGAMYASGEGVPKDRSKATEWYLKAAEQGNTAAILNLGNMYYYGKGVPVDYAKAVEWYERAAAYGDSHAEKLLDGMRAKGLAAPKTTISKGSLAPPSIVGRPQPADDATLRHLATDDRLMSGSVLVDELRKLVGKGKLTLDNGLTEDAYVKLVQNGKLVAAFYVRSHEKFTYSTIPDGIYTVAYCTGYGWDGTVRNFARGRNAHRYDNPLNYSTRRANDGSAITTYTDVMTLTLHKVAFGNAKASDMSLEDFDRY